MMADDRQIKHRLKACGRNVKIAPDAVIEHPEAIELGDNVTIMKNFHWIGGAGTSRIGSDVTFCPNCFIEGDPGHFTVQDYVTFFPGQYISLGNWDTSFVRIGHHSHFAPSCVLYGWGGLDIGAYCNVAAHVVFATVGHHEEITDRPMALSGEKAGPIRVEQDVWVAANATITAGVTLATGCVIGANAVVTRDTEPMAIYAGVPARWLRSR